MILQIGQVLLPVVDLVRFERDTTWTEDGADLESIQTVIGAVATYAPGGYPRLPSATALSTPTVQTLDATDPTAATVRLNVRGANPSYPAPSLETDVLGPGAIPPTSLRSGPETDAELRAHLWRPRQKVILWAFDRQTGAAIRWLESPRPGFSTDLGNGPKTRAVDVISASGEPNSLAVYIEIETEMSPCPAGSDRLVLSHRWEMAHTHDENHYLTRIIRGQIRFNGAVVRATNTRPDDVRAQFIHPIPLGFERRVPECVQSSDGLTIRYTITDTDPTITFDPGSSGAVKMSIVEKVMSATGWTF